MLMNRIIGVFKLRAATFEEIEHDQSATSQAFIVVAITALLSAIGSALFGRATNTSFVGAFISTLLWTFIGWFLWSGITYIIGTTVFKGQATFSEMLRTIGFAYAPQILGIIPCLGPLVGGIWSLLAGFIAVRQGLDLDDLKSFITIVIGFIVYAVGYLFLSVLTVGLTALLR
jgi:hypothetical protein